MNIVKIYALCLIVLVLVIVRVAALIVHSARNDGQLSGDKFWGLVIGFLVSFMDFIWLIMFFTLV